MVYRITYKGEEVCRISSNLKLTQQEILDFLYRDKKAAYETGIRGFCKDGNRYYFDYEWSDMHVTEEDDDEVRYFCQYC